MDNFKFILFDSEFTAWEGSFERGWSEPWEHRELIQISAALLSFSNEISIESEFDIFVKPSINKTLSDYIKNLTNISQEDVDVKGLSLMQALNAFREFSLPNNIGIYCWGADEVVFRENCALNDIEFSDYFTQFYDIRDVFERAGIKTSEYQSGNVYKSLGIKMDVHQHYAANDVKSMVVSLQELHKKEKLTKNMFKDCSGSSNGI